MATDPLTSIGSASDAGQAIQAANEQNAVLGKDDFLMLLVTQLENQDPLDPMDNTEFVAQLATFSSLEQLQNVNTGLEQVKDSMSVMNQGQAVSYIGKNVRAAGSALQVADGQTDPIRFSLNEDAASVFVSIYDEMGGYVASIEHGGMSAGENELTWDGKDNNGELVDDGVYHFEIAAVNSDGDAVLSESISVAGMVTGVTYESGVPYLMVNDQALALNDVIEVTSEADGSGPASEPASIAEASEALASLVSEKDTSEAGAAQP